MECDYEKVNLVTRKNGTDLWKCKNCGREYMRYGLDWRASREPCSKPTQEGKRVLVLKKKKKSTGSAGDYPKKRTAKRTAAFKLHKFLGKVMDGGDYDLGFEGKEQKCAEVMLRPVLDRLAKICGVGE